MTDTEENALKSYCFSMIGIPDSEVSWAIRSALDTIDRLKARIAELESRPDPPGPIHELKPIGITQEHSGKWHLFESQEDQRAFEASLGGTGGYCRGMMSIQHWIWHPSGNSTSAPAAIDPDMPRRFRHKFYSYDAWKYGVCFPGDRLFLTPPSSYFGCNLDGKSVFPHIEWIDPAPAVKKGDVT